MIDRTAKVLLLAIAIGTWLNVIMIKDQLNELHEIKFHLGDILQAVRDGLRR